MKFRTGSLNFRTTMRKFLTLFTLMLTVCTSAQKLEENKWGGWYMYFGTNRVSEKLSVHSEAQLRYYETTSNFNQLLLRTGLNYHINPNAIATFGYAYVNTDSNFGDIPNETHSKEHRIFQQFILKSTLWEFLIEHRYRLEQRFIDSVDPTVRDTQHRARYRLQLRLPLTSTFFLNFYDEIYLNLQDDIFNQNRIYAAIGVNVTENSSLQLGYLKNHFSSADFNRLQIGITYNPDLRKKKQ